MLALYKFIFIVFASQCNAFSINMETNFIYWRPSWMFAIVTTLAGLIFYTPTWFINCNHNPTWKCLQILGPKPGKVNFIFGVCVMYNNNWKANLAELAAILKWYTNVENKICIGYIYLYLYADVYIFKSQKDDTMHRLWQNKKENGGHLGFMQIRLCSTSWILVDFYIGIVPGIRNSEKHK